MGGRGGSGRGTSAADAQAAFDAAVREMAKAELARRAAVKAVAEKVKPTEVSAPQHAITALDALRARVSAEEMTGQAARDAADAVLAKVKGRELDALAKHYSSSAKSRTASHTRENVREIVVGRLADSLTMRRIGSYRR